MGAFVNREVEFDIEDIVYVKTDDKQLPRIVQSILFSKREIRYQVALNDGATYFFDFELSKEKSFLVNNNKIGFK